MRIIPYNRDGAYEYARTWALKRNPRYYDFSKIGGDCTSFVSQCIFAGTGIMNYTPVTGWYYISADNRTASWTSVEYLYAFLTQNNSSGPFGKEVSSAEINVGDIVQLGNENGDFYHSLIIISTKPVIMVAAHDFDAWERPIDFYRSSVKRFIHIDGARY